MGTEMKKYELTDETLEYNGKTLYRIKAFKDFKEIKAGDLGGFVESEKNLSHEGEDVIRLEHGCQPGWIRVEEEVPHMGLREVVRILKEEGYTDESILIELEC